MCISRQPWNAHTFTVATFLRSCCGWCTSTSRSSIDTVESVQPASPTPRGGGRLSRSSAKSVPATAQFASSDASNVAPPTVRTVRTALSPHAVRSKNQ